LLLSITLLCTAAWRALGERAERVRNPNTDALWVVGTLAFVVSFVAAAIQ
jgi:hypothetical protein